MIYYIYNGDELLGFVYKDKTYYYHKNIFGDIIGILDSNYNEIVSYEYDSWGALVNITDNSNINLGTINPFRYRSYYYDTETQLYYLNSRYYNPQIGRFINADSMLTSQDFIGFNMFCYSLNNFIIFSDPYGTSVLSVILLSAIAGGISQIISNVLSGEKWYNGFMEAFTIGACAGVVGGALLWALAPAVEIYLVSQISVNIVAGLGASFTSSYLNYESGNLTKDEAVIDFTFSSVLSTSAIVGIKDPVLDFTQSTINGFTTSSAVNTYSEIKNSVSSTNKKSNASFNNTINSNNASLNLKKMFNTKNENSCNSSAKLPPLTGDRHLDTIAFYNYYKQYEKRVCYLK